MIQELTIQNFKQFASPVTVKFDPLTILIGLNNSGKSSVLQALMLFQDCLELTRVRKNGKGVVLEGITKQPDEFHPLRVVTEKHIWPNGQTKLPIKIGAVFTNGARISFEVRWSFNRFGIKPHCEGDVAEFITGDALRIRAIPIHRGLALREQFMLPTAVNDLLREEQHGAVLRNLLWQLRKEENGRWDELQRIVRRLYPGTSLEVAFDEEVDRFIHSTYEDGSLTKGMDVIMAGTGFQQIVQIFATLLAQRGSVVLVDEPDAHLHANVQMQFLDECRKLAEQGGVQVVLATHSPHLIGGAPSGSLRAMIGGRAVDFAHRPEHMELLTQLGAFDRMEVVPLLTNKAVVFVEDVADKKFLRLFAGRLWGEEKADRVFSKVSFLYSYQEPLSADVKRLARQVKDLLNTDDMKSVGGQSGARFLVIGDRDYRETGRLEAARKELLAKATGENFKLTLDCAVWKRNEIENYFLESEALCLAAESAQDSDKKKLKARAVVEKELPGLLSKQKDEVRNRIGQRLMQDDYQLRAQFQKTAGAADKILEAEWGDGLALCDAKAILSSLRGALQEAGVPAKLDHATLVKHLLQVPADVVGVLQKIRLLVTPASAKKAVRKRPVRIRDRSV